MLYVLTYNTWYLLLSEYHIKGVFYKGTALACLITYAAFSLPIKYVKLNEKLNIIAILLALSNLLDELFFDPRAFQWNEYLAAILIITLVIGGKSDSTDKRVY